MRRRPDWLSFDGLVVAVFMVTGISAALFFVGAAAVFLGRLAVFLGRLAMQPFTLLMRLFGS